MVELGFGPGRGSALRLQCLLVSEVRVDVPSPSAVSSSTLQLASLRCPHKTVCHQDSLRAFLCVSFLYLRWSWSIRSEMSVFLFQCRDCVSE